MTVAVRGSSILLIRMDLNRTTCLTAPAVLLGARGAPSSSSDTLRGGLGGSPIFWWAVVWENFLVLFMVRSRIWLFSL